MPSPFRLANHMNETSRHTINARQIRAARALLAWSQEDLASTSDLSIATIRKIEAGHISPRDKTMKSIVSALEEADIEFTDSTGVRLRSNQMDVIEGDDCFTCLMDYIYHFLKGCGGEILFANADETRMTSQEWDALLRARKSATSCRLLIEEGQTHLCLPLDSYRWVPKRYFRYNLYCIFQNKIALCVYNKTTTMDMNKVIIITSDPLAESLKNSFEFMWENCRKPTLTTSPQIFE